jgi:peptidylprolyl isomerase
MNRAVIAGGFAGLLLVIVLVVLLTGGGEEDGADGEDLTDTSTKPAIAVPDEEPPGELVVEDIVEGEGEPAQAGDQVTVEYVGVDYDNGEQFDASWDNGQPFPFELGAGQVIEGWDQGVEGMREGGRRQLTIPPDLAYGEQGSPPTIGPNATLVFVVDLVSIDSRGGGGGGDQG